MSQTSTLKGQCIAEFLGTGLLIFFGVGCVAALKVAGASFGQWEISVIWGLGVAMAIYLTAGVSGAHLNPAVTIALWLFACFDKRKVIPFIVSQVAGAFCAAATCDIYQEDVNVVEPLFSNFGGRASFGGQIITVKCFEDNGLLYDLLEQNGRGRVLVVDGGGSVRRALVDAELARLAVQNEWEGLVIYGAVRQVDDLEELDIGIQAMAAIPVGAAGEGIGESDVRVNFGGVTFFSGDHLYADNTGIILSEDPLDIE